MQTKRLFLTAVVCWVTLAAYMLLTEPQSLPAVGLVIPFVLVFAGFYSSWRLVMGLGGRYNRRLRGFASKRLSYTVSVAVLLLLMLRSLGQLTVRDTFTVLALTVIGSLYLSRAHPSEE